MVQGIRNGVGAVGDAARDLANSAWEAVTGFFQTGSPSRLFRKGGRWAGQGLALGFSDTFTDVIASASRMAELAAEAGQVTIPAPVLTAGALGSATLAGASLTVGQGQLVEEIVRRLTARGQPTPEVRVFIGDQELTDIVRTEVEAKDDDTATRVRAGSGVTF
jgi:hypothetical protein